MARFLDLLGSPVLGRLHGINRKHRLRSKHYEPIKDWPESATIEVLDRAALETRDHFPCTDEIFVVSDKLKTVLSAVAPDVEFFSANAGGKQVWVVAPLDDNDVSYETAESTHAKYSKSGYQLLHAVGLRVDEDPESAWCQVRNASLIALGADVLAAATKANIAWSPLESIAEYIPHREHPYAVVKSSHGASADTLEPLEAWPTAPATVAHPLHDWVRDEEIDKPDVDAAWSKLVHQEDVERAAIARYCSGLPLPAFRALLDPDCAKSKVKKRWKDSTAAGSMDCMGLFVVNAAVKDLLGPSCRYTPIELRCPKLEQTYAGFSIVEPPTVEWIDWSRSDVMYLWSTMYDGFSGLHPVEDSYTATQPIVRVAGTSLILIHHTIAERLDKTFYMKRLHEVSVGLNLDDYVRVR